MATVRQIIREMGGIAKAAELFGFPPKNGYCRIANWIRRGSIPSAVKVVHYELISGIEQKIRSKHSSDNV